MSLTEIRDAVCKINNKRRSLKWGSFISTELVLVCGHPQSVYDFLVNFQIRLEDAAICVCEYNDKKVTGTFSSLREIQNFVILRLKEAFP